MRKPADQVAAAQLHPVHARDPRGFVDQPFQQVVRLGLAGAAIGVDRHRVGERAADRHADGRDVVAAAHRVARRVGGAAGAACGHAGPEIGDRLDVQRQEPARRIQPQSRMRDIVAAMRGGHEILTMARRPSHRPAQLARRPQHRDVFGEQRVLDAEAAADIRTGDLDLLQRDAEHRRRQIPPDAMHALPAEQQVVHAGRRIEVANRAAVLERGHDDAVVDQIQVNDVRGTGHGGRDGRRVTLAEAEREIAARFVPDHRRTVHERVGGFHDAGQRVVLHRHNLGGVLGGNGGFSHGKRDRLAHIAHPVTRQRISRRHDHRAVRRHRRAARDRSQPGKIGRREHAEHAGQRRGCRGIDAQHARVCVRRPDHVQEGRAGRDDVRHIAPGAG